MASGGGNGDKNQLKLYSYWRSSCSRRVRIALNLKGLKYEERAVNLLKGEQFSPEFRELNPLGYVPVLVDADIVLSDSFAIILYLEEKYPQHPLLPRDLQKKGINYQAANIVSSSIQPLQNLAILKYIEEKVGPNEQLTWGKQHIEKGFAALEKLLKDYAGRYATGDEVFLADLFLAPQLDAATKRFNVDMVVNATGPCPSRICGITVFGKFYDLTQFPLLSRLNEAYNKTPAFQDAMPDGPPASSC